MIEAQREQGYQGALAYERNGALSTFSVSSRTNDDSLLQSLQPLNRDASSRLVFNGCSPESGDVLAARLAQLYNFYITGESRVAGRQVHELLLLPLDPYRYGYGFSIDKDSLLMLRSVVMTTQREPIERIEFVSLDLSGGTSPSNAQVSCEPGEDSETGWSVAERPPGFDLVDEQISHDDSGITLVYSDGLSNVSVLLNPVENAEFPSLTTHLGATNVLLTYARTLESLHRVTLIGEVPMRSLELMASGLQYNGPSEQQDETGP